MAAGEGPGGAEIIVRSRGAAHRLEVHTVRSQCERGGGADGRAALQVEKAKRGAVRSERGYTAIADALAAGKVQRREARAAGRERADAGVRTVRAARVEKREVRAALAYTGASAGSVVVFFSNLGMGVSSSGHLLGEFHQGRMEHVEFPQHG